MIDGNAISYVAEVSSTANGWNSLVIPFNVDKVTSGSTELVAKTSPEQDSEETDYMVASLDVENNRLALTKGISANVPYLIKQTNNNATREITFTAADVTVEPHSRDRGSQRCRLFARCNFQQPTASGRDNLCSQRRRQRV